MPDLKNPNMQIPGGGFDFRQPEINWSARKTLGLHPSLATVTQAVIRARKAHPHLVQKHSWSLDYNTVFNEVKQFNVKVCMAAGWMNYITSGGGGAPVPLSQNRTPEDQKLLDVAARKAKAVFSGVMAITEWQKDGAKAVPKEQAESRAAVCVECPLNGQGDFTKWFTAPAAAAIRRQIEWLTGQKLATSLDAKLNICEGCLCAMRLKVHMPISYIKKSLSDETVAELRKGKNCWQLKEMEASA